jgi:hypothetical protein
LKAAHRQYPPLYVVATEEQALAGGVSPALDLLRTQATAQESSGMAFGDVRDSDRAVSRILHRFRLGKVGRDAVYLSDELFDRELDWTFTAMGPLLGDDPLPSLRSSPEEPWEVKHAR